MPGANNRPTIEGSILKKPNAIPEASNGTVVDAVVGAVVNSNNSARLLSHPSAASIASSSDSSAGDSGSGNSAAKEKQPPNEGETEVAVFSGTQSKNPHITNAKSENHGSAKKTSMSSTGAIPKSISFDKAVVMNSQGKNELSPSMSEVDHFTKDVKFNCEPQHDHYKGHKQRVDKSFFKSWKLPKIGRQRVGGHISGGGGKCVGEHLMSANLDEQVLMAEEGTLEPSPATLGTVEVSADDILAKYRSKPNELSSSNEVILSTPFGNGNEASGNQSSGNNCIDGASGNDFDDRLIIDQHNIEVSYAFQDAKRKLRLMLSEADMSLLTTTLPSTSAAIVLARELKATNDLVALLRVQLAEAYNLQDRNMVAQLHETLRCLSLFDNEACRKLVRSLKEDYKRRSPYLAYLVKCRQGLLATLSHQKRLLSRMEADRRVCSSHQMNVCIRLFLERREKQMVKFVTAFKESCSASDEKIALMENFLSSLWSQLEADTSVSLLTANSSAQLEMCRVAVERAVVAHIYFHAMFPNGEADISRDVVLAEHIAKLASEITPSHRYLRIGRHYHYEAPWPSAQADLRQLAAFRTPKDKVACVVRCCQTIMNLLSLSVKNSVPAADDFLPVLVFVVIKANPPSLLSTVQYVESFFGNRLNGEDQYWWMQFVAAVEFIKTMDYGPSRSDSFQ